MQNKKSYELAAEVIPSSRQLEWQKLEMYAFCHFGTNTFTGREWGDGTAPASIFNPKKLDARQWAKEIKNAGMKAIILTCKHHDGFCLWQSDYTDYCMKNSPYQNGKGDVVKEVSDACREMGLKFGVYLSPWDRHEATYGTGEDYNKYFKNQLTELATKYGDVFCFWFDGACGEGKNGKKQVYDWESYFDLIRELQPNAVINICGPDVRWCGNEAGKSRESEWSVVPAHMGVREDGTIDGYDVNELNIDNIDEPPTPIMAPNAAERFMRGNVIANPLMAYEPTPCPINILSIMLYNDDAVIAIIAGTAYFKSSLRIGSEPNSAGVFSFAIFVSAIFLDVLYNLFK